MVPNGVSRNLLIAALLSIALVSQRIAATESSDVGCYADICIDPSADSFFSYAACCENECCNKLRYWVYPASIAFVGFIAGAFFALCFQCR
ncbi:unnamed protein product [Caenorhabditis bovis]|uniref:Snake toxin/toxin-like domain-containing protein n=1 Tax=Caenorhabditis bovis TaxID=2654633 RepID=A0A8S1ECK6_9PELO|nr:unnamed protein product [Caenorhabditis bovis]